MNLQQRMAHAIRFLSVDAIVKATEGHQGVPLGMAEIATALYAKFLKHDPQDPTWFDRDRVVLSNGHGSMLLYSLLYLSGYEKISLEQIKSFRELGSHCAGHPEYDPSAGIEVTTGPLGQGIGNAVGMAIAEANLRARFGPELVNHFTYAFVGDGCLQEGVGQEAISLAGHLGLGHLVFLWDDNAITDDGATSISISENVAERFRLANWHVIELDGHDLAAVSQAIEAARKDPRPTLLACRTTIAKGIARLEGQRGGHSAPLFAQDAADMRKRFDWQAAEFEVPSEILTAWREAGKASALQATRWRERVAALSDATRTEFTRVQRGELNMGVAETLSALKTSLAGEPAIGGINLSAAITDALTDVMPERMVACADLEAPTQHKKRQLAFTATTPHGTYVHCGVREHVMGAIANGMASHKGVIPLTVTYLAFADYMRPAMRMAAMMGLPAKFVFSHDSIGIGKNGPTHQPVEVLASLRAIPNMMVLRPADAVEAVECWEIALKHQTGPVSLIFSRQVLPHLKLPHLKASAREDGNTCARGGYVLRPAKARQQATLLATGSEVAIALEACDLLEKQGVASSVVSMPSWELFELEETAYKAQVLPQGTVTVAVEAAVKLGWERYLGPHGGFVGMTGFGLSGPAPALYKHFGITAQAVADLVVKLLANKLEGDKQ